MRFRADGKKSGKTHYDFSTDIFTIYNVVGNSIFSGFAPQCFGVDGKNLPCGLGIFFDECFLIQQRVAFGSYPSGLGSDLWVPVREIAIEIISQSQDNPLGKIQSLRQIYCQ